MHINDMHLFLCDMFFGFTDKLFQGEFPPCTGAVKVMQFWLHIVKSQFNVPLFSEYFFPIPTEILLVTGYYFAIISKFQFNK